MPRRTFVIGANDEIVAVLSYWVRAWEGAIRDAKELRTAFSVPNLLSTLGELLADGSRSKDSIDLGSKVPSARMLVELREMFTRKDAAIELLRSVNRADVDALELALSNRVVTRTAFRSPLRGVVATVDDPLPLAQTVLSRKVPVLASQLNATGSFDADELDALARLCARTQLLLLDARELKSWLEKNLSLGAVRVALKKSPDRLSIDADRIDRVETRAREVAKYLLDVGFHQRIDAEVAEPLDYGYLAAATDALIQARTDCDGAAHTLARRLVAGVAATGVAYGLRPFFQVEPAAERISWQAVRALAEQIAPSLPVADTAPFDRGNHALLALSEEAASAFLRESVADSVARAFVIRHADLLAPLRRWLKEHLAATASCSHSGTLWHVAARAVHSDVRYWLTKSAAAVGDETERVLRFLATGEARLWVDAAAWERWNAAVDSAAARSESAWKVMPWSTFDAAELFAAFEPLATAFCSSRAFDVVLPVRGALFKGDAWTAGPLAWYRPQTHSLGEYAAASEAPAGASRDLHVLQRITARSVASAVSAAKSVLEPALSTLTFALSVGESTLGFRPSIDSRYFVGDVERASWSGWGGRHRADMASNEANLLTLQQFAAVYSPVIDRLANGTTRTDLEARFLRALFWYRSGRWQPNPVRRFLDHFVALEHLFAARGSVKAEPLADGVGRLLGSWMFRRGVFATQIRHTLRTAQTLFDTASADPAISRAVDCEAVRHLNTVRNAAYWKSHLAPWLSPRFVDAVRGYLPTDCDQSQWDAHVQALTQLGNGEPRWRDADAARTRDGWFLVHRLALRRNAIVHEAMTEFPGADYEADALTALVENVLIHIVEDVLTRPGVADSMDDVLGELSPPWRV